MGWGQASLPGSLPQASSRTEACHTHRGGPTLLPRFRKRASVGTDAGAVAPVAPGTIGEAKKSVADRGDWASDFDAQGPNFVLLPATLSQLLLAFLCLHPASHAKPSQLGTQNVNSKNVNSTQRKEVRNMIA